MNIIIFNGSIYITKTYEELIEYCKEKGINYFNKIKETNGI